MLIDKLKSVAAADDDGHKNVISPCYKLKLVKVYKNVKFMTSVVSSDRHNSRYILFLVKLSEFG